MRLGIDIIEIARIQAAADRRGDFAENILSPEELDLYRSYSGQRRYEFLAGRFSAKEAYLKALGTGLRRGVKFPEISILPDDLGAPQLVAGPKTDQVALSISHSRDYATAICMINPPEPGQGVDHGQ